MPKNDIETDVTITDDGDHKTPFPEQLRVRATIDARWAEANSHRTSPRDQALDASTAFEWLEGFLGIGADTADEPPAARLIGRRKARDYAQAMESRRSLFVKVLDAAAELPQTCVGDAPCAPVAAGLHQIAGDPARLVATWLALPHAYTDKRKRDALLDYRDTLVASGLGTAGKLAVALPGAICIGLLAELPGFPGSSLNAGRSKSRTRLRATLDALLDLGDTLTLSEPSRVLDLATDHVAHDRGRRARRLLATHLEAHPDDVACTVALASAERAKGRLESAERRLERATRGRPDEAAPEIRAALARTRRVARWLDEADAPSVMPSVTLDDTDRARGRFNDDTLAAAIKLYKRHGTLLIKGAFEPALLDACREQFLDEYREYLGDRRRKDVLQIGDRRRQVSLALTGAFNDPGFYANPFVLSLMHRLLDPQVIVGSTVCAASLPGSKSQHLHKDHRALFTTTVDDEPITLPPVAVTTMIPLIALDERVGTTLVRKGSHLHGRRTSERMAEQTPIVPFGSCFLMDLALSHRGQGNSTDRVRPVVNMQYTRRWFADNKNFERQHPLEIPSEEYARIPAEHRSLFDWASQPGPRVNH